MKSILFFMTVVLLASCAMIKDQAPKQAQVIMPALHIQPELYLLGDVKEGESAVASFLIRNNSAQPVTLVDIQAACGCTVAAPESYMIMPGSFTVLKVSVDTTAKADNIKKTVHIRDSLGNTAEAVLEFNVVENPHGLKGNIKGIFDGQCASCHFTPLLGKKDGAEIYRLGCAMCHGKDAEGAYAMSLRGFSSHSALKTLIGEGIGKPQMPGFAKKHGGPLTEVQLDALAHWLMQLPAEVK